MRFYRFDSGSGACSTTVASSELVASGLVGNLRPKILQDLAHCGPKKTTTDVVADESTADPSTPPAAQGIATGSSDTQLGDPRRADLPPKPTLGSDSLVKLKVYGDNTTTKTNPDLQTAPASSRDVRLSTTPLCGMSCSVWHYREDMYDNKYYFNCKRTCRRDYNTHATCDCNCFSNALLPDDEMEWYANKWGTPVVPHPNTRWKPGAKAESTPMQKWDKRKG